MSLLSPQLEAFIAIVKAKTVHGAAETLHITQTGVTQRIRALESRLNVALFVRTRRGMMLTTEGEALHRYCQSVTELAEETMLHIAGSGKSKETSITVSGPSSIMHARVIPTCVQVIKKFPQLLCHFDINDAEEHEKALKAGACQFALLQKENLSLEMQYKILEPERYVLVCSSKWKDRKLREIIEHERIIDFTPSDQMTFNYLKKFDLFDKVRLDRHYANRPESMALMMAEGCGYGVLTKEFSESYLAQNKLMLLNAGKIYENKLVLAWYARPKPPAYFTSLINSIT